MIRYREEMFVYCDEGHKGFKQETAEERSHMAHICDHLTPEIMDYIENDLFKEYQFIFYEKNGKRHEAHCTRCGHDFILTERPRHKTIGTSCPNCEVYAEKRNAKISRKYLADRRGFTWFEKSEADKKQLTARSFSVSRDCSGKDYRDIKTFVKLEAVYGFIEGESFMYKRKEYPYCGEFKRNKTVHGTTNNAIALRNVDDATEGTRFQYSQYKRLLYGDKGKPITHGLLREVPAWIVKFFAMYNQYPFTEILIKSGMGEAVRRKVLSQPNYRTINWRGKTADKILKVPKHRVREVLKSALKPEKLYIYQVAFQRDASVPIAEIEEIYKMSTIGLDRHGLERVVRHVKIKQIKGYMDKQLEVQPYKEQAEKRSEEIVKRLILSDWGDYLQECEILGMDTTDKSVLFPKNLHQAHQNTTKQVQIKENKELDKKIKKRLSKLNEYCFEKNGFLIRPAKNASELIKEGKNLNHCVGTYAERYAKGKTNIFVVRRTNDPDTPFYTAEINTLCTHVVQCRGKRNNAMTEEVEDFMEAFKDNVLSKKSRGKQKPCNGCGIRGKSK